MKGREARRGKRETANNKVAAVETGAWFLLKSPEKLQ